VVTSDSEGNTAMGTDALQYLTTGTENTGAGFGAATGNTTGSSNTAFGAEALFLNTSGDGNTAVGWFANSQDNGSYNTASGYLALGGGPKSATSSDNTAIGAYALEVTDGNNNTALGYQAGINLTTGSNNIEIGHSGVAADSGIIRIGTAGTHTKVFVAGIEGSQITGAAVYVNSNGRLGVLASSERYKTDIAPMGASSEKLAQLRPVTFRLKTDAQGTRQFGLVAEEVARVYPELVIRSAEGRIEGVRYEELAPMLLSEMQKDHRDLQQARARLETADRRLAAQERQLAELKAQTAELQGMRAQLIELGRLAAQFTAVRASGVTAEIKPVVRVAVAQ
jgi:hypothetical protein